MQYELDQTLQGRLFTLPLSLRKRPCLVANQCFLFRDSGGWGGVGYFRDRKIIRRLCIWSQRGQEDNNTWTEGNHYRTLNTTAELFLVVCSGTEQLLQPPLVLPSRAAESVQYERGYWWTDCLPCHSLMTHLISQFLSTLVHPFPLERPPGRHTGASSGLHIV